jgi:AGZA family xanthine/uracil permease-like MFS transporter
VKRAVRGKKDFWREWDFDSEELTSRDSYAIKKDRASGMSAHSPGVEGAVTRDRNWEMPVLVYGAGGIPVAVSPRS